MKKPCDALAKEIVLYMNISGLTKCQESQQHNHVQTDHQSTVLRSCNLSQEQRCRDSQTSCSKATENSGKEHESIDTRRENLHQNTSCPDADGELVRPETSNAIIEEDCSERAEGSSQHTKGRDVCLAICELCRPSYPVRFAKVEVVDERCEFGAC